MPATKTQKIIIASVFFIAVLLGVATTALVKGHFEINKIKEAQTQEAQFLMSSVDFATEQQKLTLFVRDVIMDEWTRIKFKDGGYDKAFSIAIADVREATKYPYMSLPEMALLITSVQYQESRFNAEALNDASGASGIGQFVPSTGRIMARVLGIEYSDTLLFNAETSIRMQGAYLDILLASHDRDVELALAEYNYGPNGPLYWRKDKSKLSPEALKYIPEVSSRYKGYLEAYKTYRVSLKASAPEAATTAKKEK